MRRTFRCLSLSGLIVLAGSTAFAQSGKLPDETRTQLETVVSKFMSANVVPGISIAVVKDGKFVWSKGFGMADLENSVPAMPNTLYRLGSVSKTLTATAAMELWQNGKIDLDAPVQKYCPAFPEKPWPVTTREVLGHLGGIRHYKASEGANWKTTWRSTTPGTLMILFPRDCSFLQATPWWRNPEPNITIRRKASRL